MSIAESRTRTQTIASHARLLATFLDSLSSDVETPTHMHIEHYLGKPRVAWLIFGERHKDQKDRAAAIIRSLGGHWDKEPGDLFSFTNRSGGVDLSVTVDRESVCERVVTGTREVTKSVPAPDAPTVEITETVEDVEWVCAPLLAEVSA